MWLTHSRHIPPEWECYSQFSTLEQQKNNRGEKFVLCGKFCESVVCPNTVKYHHVIYIWEI